MPSRCSLGYSAKGLNKVALPWAEQPVSCRQTERAAIFKDAHRPHCSLGFGSFSSGPLSKADALRGDARY